MCYKPPFLWIFLGTGMCACVRASARVCLCIIGSCVRGLYGCVFLSLWTLWLHYQFGGCDLTWAKPHQAYWTAELTNSVNSTWNPKRKHIKERSRAKPESAVVLSLIRPPSLSLTASLHTSLLAPHLFLPSSITIFRGRNYFASLVLVFFYPIVWRWILMHAWEIYKDDFNLFVNGQNEGKPLFGLKKKKVSCLLHSLSLFPCQASEWQGRVVNMQTYKTKQNTLVLYWNMYICCCCPFHVITNINLWLHHISQNNRLTFITFLDKNNLSFMSVIWKLHAQDIGRW